MVERVDLFSPGVSGLGQYGRSSDGREEATNMNESTL